MSFRFWRRIKIAPGVTLNLSKSGGSLSLGPRGAKYTIGHRGQRGTVGIPGTGLFYTSKLGKRGSRGRRASQRGSRSSQGMPTIRPEDRLTLGFFKRLITPMEEEALVDGCRELLLGHEDKALTHLRRATHRADGAYLAGYVALRTGHLSEAARHLITAMQNHRQLGRYFAKYEVAATVTLQITDEVAAVVGPTLRGVLLLLVEVYQLQNRRKPVVDCLQRLRRLEPDDVVVKLSLAEVMLDAGPDDHGIHRQVIRLTERIENQTPVHTGLLLYKARALHGLGLNDAARTVLTAALRRKKGRPENLMHALRYERASVYEALGQHKRAHKDLERIYADSPGYEDVAARLKAS